MTEARNTRTPTMNDYRTMLREWFGDRKYRITRTGEIHVHGTMPNTNQTGWYVYGWVGDPNTMSRIFGDANL